MGRSASMILAAVILTAASAAHAEAWVHAGTERGHRVALNIIEPAGRRDGPFTTTLAMIPLNWPANGHAYTLWIAEFDCAARSRTMKFRIAYSGRRDPVRTQLSDARAESDRSPAVAEQLDILCGESGSHRMRAFNHLGEFKRESGR